MSSIHLEFLPNPGEEEEGLGHAGIQTYRQAPYAGVARETGQNSRDAAAELPVRISYDVVDIPTESIPCLAQLQWVIAQCLNDAKTAKKEKETEFFSHAKRVLAGPTARILRIADTNTLGARGPSISGTPFYSLTKGSGVSVKGNAASGGSFGIGKNAAFSVSDIQAVFYSTVYLEEADRKFLCQGKVILVSHVGKDGEQKRQTGYWGAEGFKPLDDPADAPEWARRADVGTTVHVLGFRETTHWQERFTISLIQNFFPAIHRGEMEFSIDSGRLTIGKGSLATLFSDERLRAVAGAESADQDLELAAALYRCLASPEAIEKTFSMPELGEVNVRVLVAEGLPKKVVITRNGMVITDSLEHFGDKLARFPMYRDFVALVTPDQSGSAFIRKLEDPKHSALSAEGLPNVADRERARAVMKRLAVRIRETIKANALTQYASEVPVDELTQYFASESEKDLTGHKGRQDDPEKITYEVSSAKSRKATAYAKGDDATGGGVGAGEPGPGPAGTSAINPDAGAEGRHGSGDANFVKRVGLEGVRNVMRVGSEASRDVYFTPADSGIADIAIYATGLNAPEQLVVRASDQGEVERGRIKFPVQAGVRVKLQIELAEPYTGPVDLRVNLVHEGAMS